VTKSQYRFTDPPVRVGRARFDNLAIVPGNLLSYKKVWQQTANRLPKNAILIVLPKRGSLQKATFLAVAKLLSVEGHQVRVVAEDVLLSRTR